MADAADQQHRLGLAAYGGFVRSQLKRYGASSIDLEDLTQEVWLVALARSPAFNDERATRTWLSQVCRRVAAGERRTRARTPMLQEESPPDLPVAAEQAEQVERHFDEQESLAALARLSEGQVDVLALYGSGELSMREVADLVGEPEGTVYSRYRSAIDEVSRELRRSERVGPRTSSAPPPRMSSRPPAAPPDREAAADLGTFVSYRADPRLSIGRVGNVVVSYWRERMFEESAALVAATIKMAGARMGMPLVMINIGEPGLALPNAQERSSLRYNIRETSPQIGVAVDISNSAPIAGLVTAIVNGILLITRSDISFAMVASVDGARRWVEPRSRTSRGALPWETVARAIRLVTERS